MGCLVRSLYSRETLKLATASCRRIEVVWATALLHPVLNQQRHNRQVRQPTFESKYNTASGVFTITYVSISGVTPRADVRKSCVQRVNGVDLETGLGAERQEICSCCSSTMTRVGESRIINLERRATSCGSASSFLDWVCRTTRYSVTTPLISLPSDTAMGCGSGLFDERFFSTIAAIGRRCRTS
ncbi:hypothetical protein EDD15DRAFT_2257899 [Pisolithus albus]|nr:hypothetical protein EDD15DRAFT_2257899 [Pisolithus albus]